MENFKSVLVPSDDPAFLPIIGRVYSEAGYSVFYGKANLYSEHCKPSIVHLLWPEEFTEDIFATSDKDINRFKAAINSKKLNGAHVFHSCNNLTPHASLTPEQRLNVDRLFDAVIESSDTIHYFSEHSRRAYEDKYKKAALKNSIVTTGFSYDHLKSTLRDGKPICNTGGAKNFLVFGAIRHTRELSLLRRAWAMVDSKDLSLNLTARYFPLFSGGLIKQVLQKASLYSFLKKKNISWDSRYISDDEIEALMNQADALIVLRDNSLSSGIPLLGMTFGKLIIAPSLPTIAEYLEGTSNILYNPGDSKGLARAIKAATELDLDLVYRQNLAKSKSFNLAGLRSAIENIAHEGSANGSLV